MVVGPVREVFDESGADGVVENVSSFGDGIGFVSEAMIEEAFLPIDFELGGGPTLPVSDNVFHRFLA